MFSKSIIVIVSGLFLIHNTAWADDSRKPPLPMKMMKSKVSQSEISKPSVTPSAIATGRVTRVVVKTKIPNSNVISDSVIVINSDSKKILGHLNDNGLLGDRQAGDGVFAGIITVMEDKYSSVSLQVSADSFSNGVLQKVTSPTFDLSVQPSITVSNKEDDFYAFNAGKDGISFYFSDMPEGVESIQIARSKKVNGVYETVLKMPTQDLTFPVVYSVDGTLSDFYYKLTAFFSNGAIAKTFSPVFIPRYLLPSNEKALEQSLLPLHQAKAASTTPIYNQKFITDDIFEDYQAMTAYQIRDLFEEKGSFLKTDTLDDTIADTDGSLFNPAKTIAQLAETYKINPQMILVSMQKESSLITKMTRPTPPKDGFMGAKSCASQTIQGQLDCGISRFRRYLNQLDSGKATSGGWKVGAAKKTTDGKLVTPTNRATAALWTYTPVVGAAWGGTGGGTALNVAIWYPTLFKNVVHILKWHTSTSSEVSNQGWKVDMGIADRTSSDSQSSSIHGVSAGLPPNASYTVNSKCEFHTWDSYVAYTGGNTGYWDLFSIGITESPYWNMTLTDPVPKEIAAYQYGGAQYGTVREDQSISDKDSIVIAAKTNVVSYLNVVLDTQTSPEADSDYPSWGTCFIKKVMPKTKLGAFGIVKMPD